MTEKRDLKKQLGALSATSVVVGCVIGAGVRNRRRRIL